ncbi:MAG: manganese efflux pump MntP family protein [Spirochaetes bacterium]|nr:manganese efflux pump MntP family protein [Spirochaetota bacterium]
MIEILIIAIGLAMDAFSVCVGYGTCFKTSPLRSSLRLSFHTGLFQAGMPLIGWSIGLAVGNYIQQYSQWIAAAILFFIGIHMLIEALNQKDECNPVDFSRGKKLLLVCLATSIDALAAGFSIQLLAYPVGITIVIIGLVTFILSLLGIYLGRIAGLFLGKISEIIGSFILILLAIKIIIF